MTPEPTPEQAAPAVPNIVGLVKRDVGRAVRDAATATSSPYFGHAHLHRDLDRLRQRLALLEQRRPDLLAQVADHFHVPPTAQDVAAAAHDLAHRLLDRRYLQPDAHDAAPGWTSPAPGHRHAPAAGQHRPAAADTANPKNRAPRAAPLTATNEAKCRDGGHNNRPAGLGT